VQDFKPAYVADGSDSEIQTDQSPCPVYPRMPAWQMVMGVFSSGPQVDSATCVIEQAVALLLTSVNGDAIVNLERHQVFPDCERPGVCFARLRSNILNGWRGILAEEDQMVRMVRWCDR
jgi:hypothetical protein